MSRLNEAGMREYFERGDLVIVPPPVKIAGITADLTLGGSFKALKTTGPFKSPPPIDLCADCSGEYDEPIIVADGESLILEPRAMVLGVTNEHVEIPNDLVGWVDGRSSLARLGLFVHVTAGRIDPGWAGKIVLEFINAGPRRLTLKVGMPIASITFEELNRPVEIGYRDLVGAKYHNQDAVAGSRIRGDSL